uniref:Uncharacterized protein n=1 Tax=Rhizophora mucronata TaxID=61149 RepID=A0A2P2NP66_RHIMU
MFNMKEIKFPKSICSRAISVRKRHSWIYLYPQYM